MNSTWSQVLLSTSLKSSLIYKRAPDITPTHKWVFYMWIESREWLEGDRGYESYQCHSQREGHQFQQKKQGEERKDFSMTETSILWKQRHQLLLLLLPFCLLLVLMLNNTIKLNYACSLSLQTHNIISKKVKRLQRKLSKENINWWN